MADRLGGPVIYEPRGRAREYAALSCNLYSGCQHGCLYCYQSEIPPHRSRIDFMQARRRGENFIERVERDATLLEAGADHPQVLLSFVTDPYQPLNEAAGVTRQAIRVLHAHGLPVCVLTKGGKRALADLDLFGEGDAYAATLTQLDPQRSVEWEPGAALPQDRIEALRAFHAAGVRTWVSLEPVLDPQVAILLMRVCHEFVDVFKVGKLNYHAHALTIDWAAFARRAVAELESLGYRRYVGADPGADLGRLAGRWFYVKRDLAKYLEPEGNGKH